MQFKGLGLGPMTRACSAGNDISEVTEKRAWEFNKLLPPKNGYFLLLERAVSTPTIFFFFLCSSLPTLPSNCLPTVPSEDPPSIPTSLTTPGHTTVSSTLTPTGLLTLYRRGGDLNPRISSRTCTSTGPTLGYGCGSRVWALLAMTGRDGRSLGALGHLPSTGAGLSRWTGTTLFRGTMGPQSWWIFRTGS